MLCQDVENSEKDMRMMMFGETYSNLPFCCKTHCYYLSLVSHKFLPEILTIIFYLESFPLVSLSSNLPSKLLPG